MLRFFGLLLASLSLASAPVRAEWTADPPAKASDWKPAASSPIALGGGAGLSHVAFADHFGPFALRVDSRANEDRIVYDLRTGRESARLPQPVAPPLSIPELLSPDGATSARQTKSLGRTLELTTVADRTVRTVELPVNFNQYTWLDSARLVATGGFGKQEFVIVDAAKGTAGKPIPIPGIAFAPIQPTARTFATSPGGRYAAIPTEQGIALLDTSTSTVELIHKVPLKAALNANRIPVPPAVAFSADGSQLAVLSGAAEGTLKIFTAGSAEAKTVAVVRAKQVGSFDLRPLQPIRAGGWLIDDEVLLNSAGESVRTIPNVGRIYSPRLALDADTVLGVRGVNSGASFALDTLGESGVKVAPATVGDFRNARKKPLNPEPFLGSFFAASAVAALPPAATVGSEARPFVSLHAARSGKWAVLERDFSGFADTVQKRAVCIWGPAGVGPAIELPPERRVFGELAEDAGFLTIDAKPTGPTTLAFHNPKGEMLCRWQPVPNAKTDGEIRYAAVIDSRRVVTLDRAGLLVGWKVPECEAEWTLDLSGAALATLSPGGDQLLLATPTGLHVVSAQFGEHRGKIAADLGNAFVSATIAIRGDGNQIALGQLVGFGRKYTVWNLFAQRTTKRFDGPPSSGPLVYLGENLLFDGRSVIDIQRETVVGEVSASLTRFAVSQPADGRIWHLHAEPTGSATRLAAAAPYPVRGIGGLLGQADASTNRFLEPGSAAWVELDWPAAPPRISAQALEKVTAHLRTGKVGVVEGSPVTLRLNTQVTATGETLNLTWRNIEKLGKQEVLKPYSVRCTSELLQNGKVIQTGTPLDIKMQTGTPGRDIIITDDSKTAKEFFERQVWGQVLMWAGSNLAVPGATTLSASGQPISLPIRSRLVNGTVVTDWPQGYVIPHEGDGVMPPALGVEEPDFDSQPQPVANQRAGWILIAACGGAFVLVFGVVIVGLLIWMSRRKKTARPAPERRPPSARARRLRDDGDD